MACGFVVRCAREREDSGEPRISKIVEIVRASQFGIHDVSRVELDEVNQLPRFNMPLELGLFLGAKACASDSKQKKKRCLILDTEAYRYQKFISDIAGQDIRAHHGDPAKALAATRNWLATICTRPLPGAAELNQTYAAFIKERPTILKNLRIREDELQFVEYVTLAQEWLKDREGRSVPEASS
ncbi:MAG: hypothetical protein WCS43_09135 [Verrucomicrobiota bacterium]